MFSRETYFFYFIDSFMHCACHPTHRGRSGAVIGPSTDRCTTPHSHSLCLLISKFTCCPVPVVFSFSLSLSLPLPPRAFFFFFDFDFSLFNISLYEKTEQIHTSPYSPNKAYHLRFIRHLALPHPSFLF